MADSVWHEFLTEVLDEASWPSVLTTIVEFLRERDVDNVMAEFGFVLSRDLRGEKTPDNCVIALNQLQTHMEQGFRDGTIEWGGSSDFQFAPLGLRMAFMLCNDEDLHFRSPEMDLLLDLGRRLSRCGVKVYHSGKLVETHGE